MLSQCAYCLFKQIHKFIVNETQKHIILSVCTLEVEQFKNYEVMLDLMAVLLVKLIKILLSVSIEILTPLTETRET